MHPRTFFSRPVLIRCYWYEESKQKIWNGLISEMPPSLQSINDGQRCCKPDTSVKSAEPRAADASFRLCSYLICSISINECIVMNYTITTRWIILTCSSIFWNCVRATKMISNQSNFNINDDSWSFWGGWCVCHQVRSFSWDSVTSVMPLLLNEGDYHAHVCATVQPWSASFTIHSPSPAILGLPVFNLATMMENYKMASHV